MPIQFFCACGQQMNAPDPWAGKRCRCLKCRAVLVIPPPPERAMPSLPATPRFQPPHTHSPAPATAPPRAPKATEPDPLDFTAGESLSPDWCNSHLRHDCQRGAIALWAVALIGLGWFGLAMFLARNVPPERLPAGFATWKTLALAEIGLFFVLGLWTWFGSALPPFLGLLLFLTDQIVLAVLYGPLWLLSGWVVKLFIILALIDAIRAGCRYQVRKRHAQASGSPSAAPRRRRWRFSLAGFILLLATVASLYFLGYIAVTVLPGDRKLSVDRTTPAEANHPTAVQVVEWYTADELGPHNPLGGQKLQLNEQARRAGMCFLVVEARLEAKLLMMNPQNPRQLDLSLKNFKLEMPDGGTLTAEGARELLLGAKPGDGRVNLFVPGHIQVLAPEGKLPIDTAQTCDCGVFFLVKRNLPQQGPLRFRFKDQDPLPLTANKRR